MDNARRRRIEEIFREALAQPIGERGAYVAAACDGDDDLRHAVESLIAQGGPAKGGLDAATVYRSPLGPNPLAPDTSLLGRQLGPYHVVDRLGSGGMGEVYRAQDMKLRRDVTLKGVARGIRRRCRTAGALRARGPHARRAQSSTHRSDLRTRKRLMAYRCSSWN